MNRKTDNKFLKTLKSQRAIDVYLVASIDTHGHEWVSLTNPYYFIYVMVSIDVYETSFGDHLMTGKLIGKKSNKITITKEIIRNLTDNALKDEVIYFLSQYIENQSQIVTDSNQNTKKEIVEAPSKHQEKDEKNIISENILKGKDVIIPVQPSIKTEIIIPD